MHAGDTAIVIGLAYLRSPKRKGDFSRESSPSLSEFFEDLVRLPNHNIVISESPVIHKLTPAFL
jgi:hypothetical protein